MLRTMLPVFIALSVFQINAYIDTNIAYFLSPKAGEPDHLTLLGHAVKFPVRPGDLAALARTNLLYQFPLGVFGISIATAVFPALARAAADRSAAGAAHFREILRHGLRLTVFIGLPASVGLFLVRLPVCRAVYEGRAFTKEDSLRCALILAMFAPAIWAYSMTHVLTRAFYAAKDSRTPMVVSICMVVLNLSLNLTLVWSMGVAGLGVSTAVAAIVQCIILLRLLRRHVEHPLDASVTRSWAKTALLSLLMGAAVWPLSRVWDLAAISRSQVFGVLALLVGVGGVVYLAGAWLLRCEELGWLVHRRAE
jgi:putative peptidoglycan lipid II flippase